MVDTHSYMLSPLGPALQFGGGSTVISASSFWMRFAEVLMALEPLEAAPRPSRLRLSPPAAAAAAAAEAEEAEGVLFEDISSVPCYPGLG